LVSLEEENKALETELQRPAQNNVEVKNVVCDMENNGGWAGVYTLETDKMIWKSSEQEEQNPVVSRQDDTTKFTNFNQIMALSKNHFNKATFQLLCIALLEF